MTRWSPARLVAPAALLIVLSVASAIVVLSPAEGGPASRGSSAAPAKPAGPRIYRVRRGDTLSLISIRTDVPLSTLRRLNHSADSLALQPGQPIKLRPIRR